MAKLGRLTPIRLLFFGVLVVAATSWAQTRAPIAEQLAKTYGLDSFGQVEAVRYTFNLKGPGLAVTRSWVWQPKTGQISYEGKDKDGKPVKVNFVQSKLNGESAIVKDKIDCFSSTIIIGWPSLSMFTGTPRAPMYKRSACESCRSGRVRGS